MTELDWKKTAAVYQIYPRSFADSDGDGLGDIPGIIAKLDHIAALGCDVIWLTPVYDSPQNDNGYDIRNYHEVYPPFGTMADLEELLEQAHARGIKLVMDMVVNHCSTEHEWFVQARTSRDNPYRDYFIWKDPAPDGGPPTNWVSKFGGNAWEYDEQTGQYYLHLFDVTQADLNWENPKLRAEVYEMMRWWFEKGMDGFRLDVVNLLSKDQSFPQAPEGTDGRQFYTDGPRIHEFLHEMNVEAFRGKLTVGEMSSTTVEHCVRYTRPENQELDMTFSFHHLKVDYPGGAKWTDAPMDFLALKDILTHWQVGMAEGGGWNAVFWCNHDQPRVVSRFGDDGEYRVESGKMLGTAVHLLQGTPYIYQGEEFGMTNPHFTSISQYKDVESLNAYRELLEAGKPEAEVLAILDRKSRDNSRTPVQWDDSPHGGFTTGEPWIEVAANYPEVNAAAAVADPDSVFHHYRKLIGLRKSDPLVTTGRYELLDREHPSVYAYLRRGDGEALLVVNNFYADPITWRIPAEVGEWADAALVLGNYPGPEFGDGTVALRPYESVVLRLTN
ncbi:MAG: alpha,alpha-phosphotrehalase [Propionicimonas sp.]